MAAPQVYKVTMFMTPDQWDRISKWSAPGAVAGGDRAPWLHLEHEHDKYADYQSVLSQVHHDLSSFPYTVHVDDLLIDPSLSNKSRMDRR